MNNVNKLNITGHISSPIVKEKGKVRFRIVQRIFEGISFTANVTLEGEASRRFDELGILENGDVLILDGVIYTHEGQAYIRVSKINQLINFSYRQEVLDHGLISADKALGGIE